MGVITKVISQEYKTRKTLISKLSKIEYKSSSTPGWYHKPMHTFSLTLFVLNTDTSRNSCSFGPYNVIWYSSLSERNKALPAPCMFLSHLIQLYPGMEASDSPMSSHNHVSVMHTTSSIQCHKGHGVHQTWDINFRVKVQFMQMLVRANTPHGIFFS